ncbi:MAG: hypothetical protein DCC50_02935, partial [Acidobacteria bacterium]
MSVSYSAFGELRVSVDGVTTSIGRRRERQVLATLIATRGTAVPAARLATDLWGQDAGPTALGLVQVAVSRLRSLLEPDRPSRGGTRIVSTTAGYLLRAQPDAVDVWAYEDLARRVLDHPLGPEQVVEACTEAEALWSTPYAGVEAPESQAHADRLHELHTDLLAQHARVLLDLDHPDAAVRLLSPVVGEHPYRETLWCLHALAQYRSGRQAGALETMRRLRAALADDLGVDPVAETTALEQQLLHQDHEALTQPLLTGSDALRTDRPRGGPALLVGRDAETARGVELLRQVVDEGRTRFLLVTGEPGIGKSAWLARLTAHAQERGFEVLTGHNHGDDLVPALWPWIEMVRSVLDEAPPEVAEVVRSAVSDEPARTARPMLAFYEAVLALLADRARRRPLLVVLEDLGHADSSTLRLLRHVAEARLQAPVVVALSRRTTEEAGRPVLGALAALSRAGVVRVHLEGLPTEAVAELIGAVAGPHAAELDEHVTRLTGGNPFFVRHYAALLAGRQDLADLDPATLPIPYGVRDVLRERIDQLPEEVVRVLLSASVLGRTVTPELVAALLDLPTEEVLSALDVAAAAGLLVEDEARYSFVHALAVDTAYGQLSAPQRVRLHDRASRLLEEQVGPGPDTVTAIASHALAARDLSSAHRERAATWRARAADAALHRHAWAEALEGWRDVLDLASEQGEAVAHAHHGAATALLHLSRGAEAQRQIEQGIRVAHALRAWDLVVEMVGTQATMAPWSWPAPGADREAFIAAIDDALVHVGPGAQALLLVVRDIDRCATGSGEPRGQDTARALELARDAGDVGLLQVVLVHAITATQDCWPPQRRQALVHELLATGPDEGSLRVGVSFLEGLVAWENRLPEESDAAMEDCARAMRRLGFTRMRMPLAWWRATRARDRDADDATELLDAAVAQHRRAGWSAVEDVVCLAVARREGGRHVVRDLEDCPTPSSAAVAALLAHAVLEAGEPALARRYLESVLPRAEAARLPLAAQCFRLLVLAGTGTEQEVRAALGPVEARRGELVTVENVLDHAGVVEHFLAAGYAAVGDPRAA